MSEHTPGPWRLDASGNVLAGEYGTASFRTVATCMTVRGGANHDAVYQTNLANGRLCAAAPDLLAACEAIANATGLGDMTLAGQKVAAAIAKARGKSPK